MEIKLNSREKFLSIILLLSLFSPVALAENSEWFKESDEFDNPWSDFSEAKPDVSPDGWSVDRLVRYSNDEILLRSSSGAMLRWLPMMQLRALNSVRKNISRAAETQVDFFIIKGDEPNAAAGNRNGRPTMFVNFGMLDMIGDDSDLWAALIGHEIAHLKLGHIDKRSKRSVPLAVVKGIAQAALGANPLSSTASGLLIDGIGLKFDRDAERQSDYMGVIWAVEAGYDAQGAASLHTRISEQAANFSIPFLNSHPSSKERIETLSKLGQRLSK